MGSVGVLAGQAGAAIRQAPGPIRVDTAAAIRIAIGSAVIGNQPHKAVLLRDRTIIAIGGNGRQLTAYDSSGRRRWHYSASRTGSAGYRTFTNILHDESDRAIVWDARASRLTTIDDRGHATDQQRVDRPPRVDLGPAGRSMPSLRMEGQFTGGEFLATVIKNLYRGRGLRAESTTVYRVATGGGLSPLGQIFEAERYLFGGGKYAVMGERPFGRVGRIAVAGSSWWYTDGGEFTIERHRLDGRSAATVRIDRSRISLGTGQILSSRRRALREAEPRLKPDLIKALAWMPYPDSMPTFADLESDPLGVIWARVFTPYGEQRLWELFDSQGRQLGAIRLPAEIRVLDITADGLLAYRDSPDGAGELLVYPIERAR